MLGTLSIDLDGGRISQRIVPPDIFNDAAVAGGPGVSYDDAVAGSSLHAHAHEANFYHVFGMLPFEMLCLTERSTARRALAFGLDTETGASTPQICV
jgi:hypothetical protein